MTGLVIRNRKIYRGRRWTATVVICFVIGLASVGTAAGFYIRRLQQEQRVEVQRERLRINREEIRLLSERLRALQASTKTEVATPETIRESLKRFEQQYLTDPDAGLSAVILQINKTARGAGVTLSDIAFNPIEEGEVPQATPSVNMGRGRQFYPGLKMAFTVTGAYPNIRQFLVELERGPIFLIVESLALKSVEEGRAGRAATGAASDVTLSLEVRLSVYYRRQGAIASLVRQR
ncbi:MAG TPA: GspMb/PilO family protein [Blastocatellia bacterium]|nr:GspMb/PilO family protein [Blastocatellia bacterium]